MVGGAITILKNMSESQWEGCIMENNPNVPNHQPDKLQLHLLCSDAQIYHNTPYIKLLEEYHTHIPMIFPIIANSITIPGSLISIPNTSIQYVIHIRSPYIHNMLVNHLLYPHYIPIMFEYAVDR